MLLQAHLVKEEKSLIVIWEAVEVEAIMVVVLLFNMEVQLEVVLAILEALRMVQQPQEFRVVMEKH
jgi:hypothetical protein